MNYRYKKGQIFAKRLKVPKYILNKVYTCRLSFNEFIEYQLDNKIPTSCIEKSDREIVEKFGIDKCKEVDWELRENEAFFKNRISFCDILMSIDSQTKDINHDLYELVKNQIDPSYYSPKMSEIYSDRLFEIPKTYNITSPKEYEIRDLKICFNSGNVDLNEIINNWDLFKEKDLSYCLLNDKNNINNITDSLLKNFMNNYGVLVPLIVENNDIYTIIDTISNLPTEEEKRAYFKQFTDVILSNTYENSKLSVKLTNEQYKELFKYSSIDEYLENWSPTLVRELSSLPKDYVFNMPIPFSELLNHSVLIFIEIYGLKNIVDFDNECGHFFTKNNCEMLKSMYNMYLLNAGLEHNPNRTIFTKSKVDENGNNVDRPYTKDEFYEAMRRIIIYRRLNIEEYADKDSNYKNITGEFRARNADLFISEQAPEELQNLFYEKSITPQLLLEHPEYINFLNGKNLASCFKNIEITIKYGNKLDEYLNIYQFLGNKMDYDDLIKFITEYADVLDVVFCNKNLYSYLYNIEFSDNDDINTIKGKIHDTLRRLIIERGFAYPKHIPKEMIARYPSMFLDKKAPQELQEAFYSRTITSSFILSNSSYKDYLNGVDLESLFKYMPVKVIVEDASNNFWINLVSAFKKTFSESEALDVMLMYYKYIEQVYEENKLQNFLYNPKFTQNEFLDELDKSILQNIIAGNMKYDESIPSHFKNNNPTLFLDSNVSEEIKNKFYNRKFTLDDFNNNSELLNVFENTNIACAFPENMAWIIPLFNDSENIKTANYNRMQVITAYSKIKDVELQKVFKEYIIEFSGDIDVEKIKYAVEILSRLSISNSSELFIFRKELATQILRSDNPLQRLSKIEAVFIKNNIPIVGKVYSCFEILHPDFQGFNFDNSMVSPVLKSSSTTSKKMIVFSDLIKSSFGSNNRSVNTYLKNIEYGSKLYESIKSGQTQFDMLGEDEIMELTTFCNHLATLYNNSTKAKKLNDTFTSSGYVWADILELSRKLSPDGTLNYNLGDRVIRMFCGFTGIDTLEQAKEYIERKVKNADSRNREAANSNMVLEQGDFIKGIGNITYLRNILQNGSVSKEYLGSSAGSDNTPLDTDVSMIMSSAGKISEKINATAASSYGPIWFVLKNDDRFMTTRTSSETLDAKKDMSKLEAFYTGFLGKDHYGIRTGFASSEINYIIMDNYDPRVGLEIAMNGFYIPVVDKEGKIIFTPKDYDKIRAKMSGLSYFEENNYIFSENLITEETEYFAEQIEQSNFETQIKREKINRIIKKSLEELGLCLKINIDGDLTEGFVELIDTGSTGRGTNKPGDGDFDFMMRLDKTLLTNPERLNELKQTILRNLGRENSSELTGTGDFRLKGVQIDTDMSVDIDITFTEKTDKVLYSTDMALQDRLTTIQKNDPEKYKYVIANILFAKKVLKQAEAYKPNRGEVPQGGLGGVGIENWILQNGGSFIDAAKSFVEAAEGNDFEKFQSVYQIWDFGDNHLAERRGNYSHDNFVANNMSEVGYQKMVQALKEYLKAMEIAQIETEEIKRHF